LQKLKPNLKEGIMFFRIILLACLFFSTILNAGTLQIKGGWNLVGSTENNITMNQLNNDNISSVWKWESGSWKIWSPDSTVMNMVKNYGIKPIYTLNKGEGFWINAKSNMNLKLSGNCPGTFLPVGTVSNDWKNGNFAIVNVKNWTTYSNLNPVPLGGDIRTYLFGNYIFVVDAPSYGTSSSWYVYKINENASSLDTDSLKTPVANYNIDGANPQGIAFLTEEKAYLTNFKGNEIIIFNPLTGEKLDFIDLTPYLYGNNEYISAYNMLVYKDKLFVTAKRKYVGWSSSDPETPDYSYIIVIDTKTNNVIKTIDVNFDPLDPQVYNGYLYFLSKGDYSAPIGKIFRVDLASLTVDDNFEITSPKDPDNSTNTLYIKNFVITNEGEMFLVANDGVWGDPYYVFKILNVDLYNDTSKTGFVEQPVYTGSYIRDISYSCNYVIIADRNQEDSKSNLIFIDKNGDIIKKISATDLGYQPFMIGTNYFYF
jgi:hypothetical protein